MEAVAGELVRRDVLAEGAALRAFDPQVSYRDTGAGPPTGAPRWVKVFGIIALVLVLLVGIMLLSGGSHGPGRHISSGDVGGHTPLAGGHAP